MRCAGIPPRDVERFEEFAATGEDAEGESQAGDEQGGYSESCEAVEIAGDEEADGESSAGGEGNEHTGDPDSRELALQCVGR